MNGVRRFLGAASTSPPSSSLPEPTPLIIKPKGPSWPPQPESPVQPPYEGSKTTTAALFLRKDRQKPQPIPPATDEDVGNTSIQSGRSSNVSSLISPTRSQTSFVTSSPNRPQIGRSSSPTAGSSSLRSSLPSRLLPRESIDQPELDRKRSSGPLNTRDELLLSLLASEAVVDSQEFDILSSEEVDDLKKEHQVLTSRLGAMTKKLSLETKIRDAAISLTKVNASHKKVSKQTDEQLEAANRRVDAAQQELWRVSDRVNYVHKRLLEHRAGVLSFSVQRMEKKMAPTNDTSELDDSGYDTSKRSTPMSPTSMTSGSSSSKPRFDGAHLFAGHADAVVPTRRPNTSTGEITVLEDKLKAATDALSDAGKKQAEMTRELSLLRLEKQEVETTMGMDLQSAEETITALEKELPRLEGIDTQLKELLREKSAWEKDREELAERGRQVGALKAQLGALQARNEEVAEGEKLLAQVKESSRRQLEQKDAEIRQLKSQWDAARAAWERDKAKAEDEKMEDLARLQEEMDRLREEDGVALQKAHQELDGGRATLRTMVQQHGIVLFSRDSSLQGLLSAAASHLDSVKSKQESNSKARGEWEVLRKKLEDDVRSGLDKREALVRDVEGARREREEARKEARSLESRAKDALALQSPRSPMSPFSSDQGDSARVVSILQPIWSILPSPEARAVKFAGQRQFRAGSPTLASSQGGNISSLSDLDVRSLKSLYDSRPGIPTSPNTSAFSLEAFAARVQALIVDDRAIIERLVRFAQAHELLKKNAERAQKLAQESNSALETYQKQVRTLEDRNMTILTKQAAMQDEVQQLQDAVDRITAEKREVEMQAAEQAETCRQLTEANNSLSARTLTLAEEAASAPEMVRKHLEGQLAECKAALNAAQDEVDAMRMSEQSQRIALLDELNSMQTENGVLRAQLRAIKK